MGGTASSNTTSQEISTQLNYVKHQKIKRFFGINTIKANQSQHKKERIENNFVDVALETIHNLHKKRIVDSWTNFCPQFSLPHVKQGSGFQNNSKVTFYSSDNETLREQCNENAFSRAMPYGLSDKPFIYIPFVKTNSDLDIGETRENPKKKKKKIRKKTNPDEQTKSSSDNPNLGKTKKKIKKQTKDVDPNTEITKKKIKAKKVSLKTKNTDGTIKRKKKKKLSISPNPEVESESTEIKNDTEIISKTNVIVEEKIKLYDCTQATKFKSNNIVNEIKFHLNELQDKTSSAFKSFYIQELINKRSFIVNEIIMCSINLGRFDLFSTHIKDYNHLITLRIVQKNFLQWELSLPILHIACLFHRADYIENLLQKGANANIVNSIGSTALHLIVEDTSPIQYIHQIGSECIQYRLGGVHEIGPHLDVGTTIRCIDSLISHGADINQVNRIGQTALLKVASRQITLLTTLISRGADVHLTDHQDKNVLHYLCDKQYHSNEILNILTNLFIKNIDVNKRDMFGNTPLHYATKRGSENITILLLENGANPNILNSNGETPLFGLFDNLQNLFKDYLGPILLNNSGRILIHNNEGKLPLLLQKPYLTNVQKSIMDFASIPFSLQRLCRYCIRYSIGISNINKHKLNELNYPYTLKNYIVNPLYSLNF